MPMWCPPTPPAGDGDVYCESWARALYRAGAAPDALLPPVRSREPRAREPRRARAAPRPSHAPLSLFERAGPRPRPRARAPAAPPPHPGAQPAQPEWAASEDAALRRALRLQRLPGSPPAALQPNWEWAAELVGGVARAYRSARACRERHEALADPARARRRHRRPPAARRRLDDDAPRPPLARLAAMRDAHERRRAQPKRRHDDQPKHNPKHAALLHEHGVQLDAPPSPMEVAERRAERIAKEKLKAAPAPGAAPAPPPARIVLAAEARRPPDAQLLYRQQTFPARHLKIIHQTAAPHAQSGAGSSSGAEPAPAVRKLQLQQVRRAAPAQGPAPRAPPPGPAPRAPPPGPAPRAPAPRAPAPGPPRVLAARAPHSHVVVAHLAPPRAPDSRQ